MDDMFYATLCAGLFLTLWGVVIQNTGGMTSLLLVKIAPAALGIWCLFECARVLV